MYFECKSVAIFRIQNLWTFYTTSGYFSEVYQQDWKAGKLKHDVATQQWKKNNKKSCNKNAMKNTEMLEKYIYCI
jgi:hypothetical protein